MPFMHESPTDHPKHEFEKLRGGKFSGLLLAEQLLTPWLYYTSSVYYHGTRSVWKFYEDQ